MRNYITEPCENKTAGLYPFTGVHSTKAQMFDGLWRLLVDCEAKNDTV